MLVFPFFLEKQSQGFGWLNWRSWGRSVTALKDYAGYYEDVVFQVRYKIAVQANCRRRDFVVVFLQQSGYQLESCNQISASFCPQRFQAMYTKKFFIFYSVASRCPVLSLVLATNSCWPWFLSMLYIFVQSFCWVYKKIWGKILAQVKSLPKFPCTSLRAGFLPED